MDSFLRECDVVNYKKNKRKKIKKDNGESKAIANPKRAKKRFRHPKKNKKKDCL